MVWARLLRSHRPVSVWALFCCLGSLCGSGCRKVGRPEHHGKVIPGDARGSHTGGCEGMTLTPLTRTLNTNSAEAPVHTDSPILTLGERERENDKHLGELFGFAHAYVSECLREGADMGGVDLFGCVCPVSVCDLMSRRAVQRLLCERAPTERGWGRMKEGASGE
jgi:hypothetical protein